MAKEDSREREAEGGIEDWYRKSLQVLRRKHGQRRCSEADVSMHLIRPCIQAVLRYPQSRIDAEASMERKRPDYVCRGPDGRAEVIVEVKNLNAPLTERVSFQAAWHTSPYGQISRYLEKYPIAQDGTWGVVTNGQEWIILRRNGQDVHQVASDKVENLAGIERVLEPILESKKEYSDKVFKSDILSQSWLDLLKNPNLTPTEFVQKVQPFRSKNLLTNRGHSFTMVKEFSSKRSVWLSCLNINLPDGHVSLADITEQILPIIEDKKAYRIYGIACWKNLNQEKLCRGFLWQQGILSTTPALDPHFPGSRGDRQIRELAETATCFDVGDIFSSIELKREFYEEIDRWFERTQKGRNDLRHMIRILFTYLLQERGIVPDTCLWDISKKVEPHGTEIHEHIQWLFTSVFAIEKRDRYLDNEVDHSKHWLIKNIPFLNGSIFTPMLLGEEPAVLKNRSYIAVGEQPGLLTILRRYDWTLHEQSGYESESALDPSMLGTLFERLMLSAEGARVESGGNIKMPGGSYYTPQDVVDEMAAEAIAHWLHGKLGHLQFEQVRDLAHPAPRETAWKQWGQRRKNEVRERLSKVTVFDPCCGSGAFTVGMLQALRRANRRLADGKTRIDRPGSLEWIVEKQLHAADIHPLAVLITRLRLFIALIDARESNTDSPAGALPNLETCCSTADTLCIELSDSKQTMQLGTDEWDKAIGDWQAARELWVRAHSEDDKVEALREERRARKALKKLAEWRPGYDSSWLDTDFLTASEQPNSIDVRKLFVAPDGWDIVIGNPPYQLSNDRERERGQRLGYIARNNLYTMFIEAAMEACKEHGCVTLVVPHSIVFRREASYKKLRKKIEEFADRIEIRTFDNRPKPVFPDIPWVKIHQTSSESRQRVTILSARKGVSHNPIITSRGLIRLDAERRKEILRADRNAIVQPRFHRQWTQAPSAETVQLLEKMWAEANKIRMQDKATRTVAFPQTAMYFVPCLPVALSPLKNPKLYKLDDDEFFWPWIGLYNSHLFHAYWLMTGDAFHVTGTDYSSVAPPAGWKDESLRAQIERAAKLLVSKKNLDACRVVHAGSGGSKWPNMNFHGRQEGREIVSILDRLLIEAYDLEEQPLLSHVRMMRTGSAHDLSALH